MSTDPRRTCNEIMVRDRLALLPVMLQSSEASSASTDVREESARMVAEMTDERTDPL